ncbi:competence pheromone ComX [Paenibacillus sp. IHBB 10380]|uniref:competence pheromone ComX n=1 Tax=Paenibacillus sp. IHBB 10380 TaxID=1566358 RepID=UPI000A754A5D|nr:competence pheromone ComX [Paenibacillus sp. IHBB 10380]
MLKELVQMLVKNQGAGVTLQGGQLQLAGISEIEQRALIDVLENGRKNEPLKASIWFS